MDSLGLKFKVKLTLNRSKTNYMDFHRRQKLNYNVHPPISLAGQNIDQVFCAKYFIGLMVDNKLPWHDDTEHISGKISKVISVLVKVKRCLNSSI